jgi:predicted RNA binding protein YcfA (HicA-like mRNA interferase family)
MARWQRVFRKLISGSLDIRFDEFVLVLQHFGFVLDRVQGSHHVFVHPNIRELLSVQPRKDGKAKPYQLR